MIKLLEELHVPVDYVAGTSMGSLVGGFYATGMTAEQLEATVRAIDFDTLFKDSTARKDEPYLRKLDDNLGLFGPKLGIGKDSQLLGLGAISGQKISFLFETLTSERVAEGNFDNLPIPYRAVATDIITGDAVVLDKGNIAVAMRASMSVPGAFDPVVMGDYMLVDGGLADNVPIDVVRQMGADIVIAVDVGTPLEPRENLTSLVSITAQLSGLLVVRNANAQIKTLTARDVLITPALGSEITSSSFDDVDKAIPIGYEGANLKRAELERLSIGAAQYAQDRKFIESCVSTVQPPVQFVNIDNHSRFEDSVIRKRLHIPLGEPLDTHELDKNIGQIYALGFLNLVTLRHRRRRRQERYRRARHAGRARHPLPRMGCRHLQRQRRYRCERPPGRFEYGARRSRLRAALPGATRRIAGCIVGGIQSRQSGAAAVPASEVVLGAAGPRAHSTAAAARSTPTKSASSAARSTYCASSAVTPRSRPDCVDSLEMPTWALAGHYAGLQLQRR